MQQPMADNAASFAPFANRIQDKKKERQYPTISVSNSVFARLALASYYGDICQHLVSCFIPCSNYFSYKSALAFPTPCKEAPCASQIFEGY